MSERELTNLQSGMKMGFDYSVDKNINSRTATVTWSITPYAYSDHSGDPRNATYHLLTGYSDFLKITYKHNGETRTISRTPERSFSWNGHTVYCGYADHNSYLDDKYNDKIFHDYNGNWTGIERYVKVLGTKWASGEFTVDYGSDGEASFHLEGKFDCYSPTNQSPMRFDRKITLPSIPRVYTITYNANGGTNSGDKTQTKLENKSIELFHGTNFSRQYFKLASWDTAASGSGTTYKLGGTYAKNASDTLYAQWDRITYTVTYKPNGGKNSGDGDQTKKAGIDLTLFAGGNFSKKGYHLKDYAWDTKADGSGDSYRKSGTYKGNHDLTLYAQWAPNTYTVTLLDYFTGKKYKSFTATYDSKLTAAQLEIMNGYEQAGYELLGWSKTKLDRYTTTPSKTELNKYRFNQEGVFKETSDIKLYPILKFRSTVYVRVGDQWKLAVPYVRVGEEWKQAIAYVRVGDEWKL